MKQQTTQKYQAVNLFFILVLALISYSSSAQVFYTEDFETDGNGTRYFPEVEATDGQNDYFMRASDNAISANTGLDYDGESGSFYWAGEDHDDGGVGGTGNNELELEFRDIVISGKTNLYFNALIAGNDGNGSGVGSYESMLDYVIVEYRIDNSAWVNGISFFENGNEFLSQDTNGDSIGDGSILSKDFQFFEFAIGSVGNEIDIRIRAASNASGEEWAIDLIQLTENSTLSNPENLFSVKDIKVYTINKSGIFKIEIPNPVKIIAFDVFDLTGKKMNSIIINSGVSSTNIDLSNLQASIYILKIVTDKGVFNKKIIKM